MLVSVFITFFQEFLLRLLNIRHRSNSYEKNLLDSRSALAPSDGLLRPSLIPT
jgi:hypothetical protein